MPANHRPTHRQRAATSWWPATARTPPARPPLARSRRVHDDHRHGRRHLRPREWSSRRCHGTADRTDRSDGASSRRVTVPGTDRRDPAGSTSTAPPWCSKSSAGHGARRIRRVISSQSGYRMPALTADQRPALATTSRAPLGPGLREGRRRHAPRLTRCRNAATRYGSGRSGPLERGGPDQLHQPGIIVTPWPTTRLYGESAPTLPSHAARCPLVGPASPDEVAALAARIMGPKAASSPGQRLHRRRPPPTSSTGRQNDHGQLGAGAIDAGVWALLPPPRPSCSSTFVFVFALPR